MIITCPNCKKQFKINPDLIPVKGRDLKCGSCDQVWFYKIEDKKSENLSINEDIISNEDKSIMFEGENKIAIDKKQYSSKAKPKNLEDNDVVKTIERQTNKNNARKVNSSSKFFSYLIVFIISFVSLVVLLDTLKSPLINVFPGLEVLLFNLFEILKDIKLFIIDLY